MVMRNEFIRELFKRKKSVHFDDLLMIVGGRQVDGVNVDSVGE